MGIRLVLILKEMLSYILELIQSAFWLLVWYLGWRLVEVFMFMLFAYFISASMAYQVTLALRLYEKIFGVSAERVFGQPAVYVLHLLVMWSTLIFMALEYWEYVCGAQ